MRPWRLLDHDLFRQELMSSPLCNSDSWPQYDIDSLAHLYDTELEAVLDLLVHRLYVDSGVGSRQLKTTEE